MESANYSKTMDDNDTTLDPKTPKVEDAHDLWDHIINNAEKDPPRTVLYKRNRALLQRWNRTPDKEDISKFKEHIIMYIRKNAKQDADKILSFFEKTKINIFSSSMMQRFYYEYGYESTISVPASIQYICSLANPLQSLNYFYDAYIKKHASAGLDRVPNDIDDLIPS